MVGGGVGLEVDVHNIADVVDAFNLLPVIKVHK